MTPPGPDVDRLAELAGFMVEGKAQAGTEITEVLEHIGLLPDDAHAGPAPPVAPVRLRSDDADALGEPDLARRLAPAWRDGFVVVPTPPALGEGA